MLFTTPKIVNAKYEHISQNQIHLSSVYLVIPMRLTRNAIID